MPVSLRSFYDLNAFSQSSQTHIVLTQQERLQKHLPIRNLLLPHQLNDDLCHFISIIRLASINAAIASYNPSSPPRAQETPFPPSER